MLWSISENERRVKEGQPLACAEHVCEGLGMRTGKDYVASLRDGRAIFLDGARVADVTAHPAFAESIRRIAEGYDAALEAPDVTTCVDPASGRRIGAMWLMGIDNITRVVGQDPPGLGLAQPTPRRSTAR